MDNQRGEWTTRTSYVPWHGKYEIPDRPLALGAGLAADGGAAADLNDVEDFNEFLNETGASTADGRG